MVASTYTDKDLSQIITEDDRWIKKESQPVIHLYELFRFTTALDWFYMMVGTIGSIGHGASGPLLWLMFGYVTDLFTNADFDLCSVDFPSISEQFCPQHIHLTAYNFRKQYKKCNYTQFNITLPENVRFYDNVQRYLIFIALIGLAAFFCAYIQSTFWTIAGERRTRRLRRRAFEALLCEKDISYFDQRSSGELTTLMSEGICKISDGIGEKLGSSVQYLSSFVTGLLIGFATGWKLTSLIVAMSPLLVISGALYSKIAARVASKEQQIYSKAGQLAEQVFTAIKTVFAFNASEYELNRYEEQLKRTRKNGIKMGSIFGLVTGFDYLVDFAADALGFWYGAKLIRTEGYSFGQTLMVFFTVTNAMFALGRSAPYIQAVFSAKGSAHSIWQIINTKKDKKMIPSQSAPSIETTKIEGHIAFVNVQFSYPSRPKLPVLKHVSFNISAGQTVAIVGSTGSGKSTCVELLERFYEPQSGFISLDGQRLNRYNLQYLRKHTSVVSQQPVLFEGTVMENIRMGHKDATDDEIIDLCKSLGIHRTILHLSKDRYQTKIIQGGSNLSGGQRQKIALARALLKNPQILLLDEATAALDNESERQIQEAIEKASLNRTTIIIAHRLSTIRHAEKIIVLDQGQVVEIGTHDSLINQRGKYFQLLQGQLLDHPIDTIEEQSNYYPQVSAEETMTTIRTVEEKEDQISNKSNFSFLKLLALNKPEWVSMLFGSITAIINGGLEPAFALILSKLVSVLEECNLSQHTRDINFYILLFIACGVLTFVTMFLQSFFFSHSGEGLTYRLRLRAFRTMIQQKVSWFDRTENSPGILCARLSTEASAVHEATGILLGISLRSFANLGVGIALGFYASGPLTLMMCIFIPLLISSGWLQTKVLSGFVRLDSMALEKAANIVAQVTQNIRTVVQLQEEHGFIEKYEQVLDEPYRKLQRRAHLNGLLFGFSNSITFFAQAALFSFGAYLVKRDQLAFEDIILIFSVVTFGVISVSQSFAMAPNYAKARSAAKKLFQLYALESTESTTVVSRKDSKEMRKWLGTIQFENVTFAYENRPDVTILKNLNLTIESGQHVAFIGASGSGKSTAIQLIERFYEHSQGKIKIDSEDISQMDMRDVRSCMALVSQEAALFDISIGDNIKYGDLQREISDEEMILAAQRANIHDFILTLPQGYGTMVGSRALQLSGGQRQRIAIARALIRRAPLLLLDEPTSALDTINEQIVQEALDEAQRDCTSITIAHRLSTIKQCQTIYVFDRGHVVESGDHQQLMDKKGYYYKLIQTSHRL